uniref:UPF0462 protein C4orf33 homolog n=1 Tax=Styela clava TaxID=7725 RepID=UPI00193A6887|nr:UPF0462 protein C4orf33 homolog [Styela clava]
MDLHISTDWKGNKFDHDLIHFSLGNEESGLVVNINAPFFNDPKNPGGNRGEPFDELWEFEVVELFFLDDQKEEYLEAEFCPHGQHQVLVLKGCRKPWKLNLELKDFESRIEGNSWTGKAILPWGYFPENVNKLNAFAIHGSGEKRAYEALYPATEPHENPDFHRLQYFQPYKLPEISVGKTRDRKIWE